MAPRKKRVPTATVASTATADAMERLMRPAAEVGIEDGGSATIEEVRPRALAAKPVAKKKRRKFRAPKVRHTRAAFEPNARVQARPFDADSDEE